MEKHTHISSLIAKLFDDNLSQEELRELQQLFHSAQAEGDVAQWLSALWETSGQQKDSIAVDSEEMLKKLMKKIETASKASLPPKQVKGKDERTLHLIRSMMRYAAVFVLAMGCSWILFGSGKQQEIEKLDAVSFSGISEVSVTYGSKSRILLPDSSVVYLNSGSQISYPPVFDGERYVSLAGEAYFIVRSDSLRPFLVHTADVSVKALGTEFNVKAYPEERSVETVLVSGVVEIFKRGQKKPIIELKPGERASYVKASEQIQTSQSSTNVERESPRMIIDFETKPDATIGWVTNQLVFDAEPFEQIAVRLERWFNVKFEIRNEALSKTRITGRYDTENIEQVMQSLKLATPFTYKIEKNLIVIR